jgi:hypothetical protein
VAQLPRRRDGKSHTESHAATGVNDLRQKLTLLGTRPAAYRRRFKNLDRAMSENTTDSQIAALTFDISREPLPTDPGANPFKLVVDPVMRIKLRRALFEMIENHDQELARYVTDGTLALESYKEYIELFARSLRETMATTEGVAYLLEYCGFTVNKADINLSPETRWKVQR